MVVLVEQMDRKVDQIRQMLDRKKDPETKVHPRMDLSPSLEVVKKHQRRVVWLERCLWLFHRSSTVLKLVKWVKILVDGILLQRTRTRTQLESPTYEHLQIGHRKVAAA